MKKVLIVFSLMIFIKLNLNAQIPSYVPSNGLKAWYPFSGNANDLSGNALNGTVNGATLTTDRFGNINKAYSFDGVNDYIVLNPILTSPFSVSFWVNVRTFKTYVVNNNDSIGSHLFGNFNNDFGNTGFSIALDGKQSNYGKHGCSFWSQINPFIQSNNLFLVNNWKHILCTYNGNTLKYFNNGILIDTLNSTYVSNNSPLTIGARLKHKNGPDFFFDGLMDDIGIWNRALNQDEITALYKGEKCSLINSATFNVPPSTHTVLQGSVLRMVNSTFNQVDTNQWNYIAWVKTSTNAGKIYKNGSLVFSGNFQNQSYSYSRLDLGAEFFTSYGGWFNGFIDEVRISNSERSATDIQNYFNSNLPFNNDANTVGLWHFDQSSGTTINATTGTAGTITNANWNAQGKFGQCLSFNGTNSRAQINQSIPTSNMTIEFWIKPNGYPASGESRPISLGGNNTTTFILSPDTVTTNYTWSTGATGNSITVNPSILPYIWVTDGNCTDTIWFNSNYIKTTDTCIVKINDTIKITKYDTIKITDTLVINATLSGVSAPNNTNRLIVYPNPAKDHITIDYGVFSRMNGYTLKIVNTLGQTVFSSPINQQSSYINLSSWTGKGMYNVQIFDTQNNMIENRKIVLQ